ncbi:LOW QUALITY PROTEIN: hypothetical protein PanWU01x14_215050 [Parasponia andersonii]|uniref:Uncharacterized protein n=1 Tax=Parasponia andersonii TaxID=3476 RepID=A0A2P5BRZ9_PARAD|nr:LOW QUALITY PROTEIN: hypothetical protein PanWU01x14_215050 [Parasponia andersonii]
MFLAVTVAGFSEAVLTTKSHSMMKIINEKSITVFLENNAESKTQEAGIMPIMWRKVNFYGSHRPITKPSWNSVSIIAKNASWIILYHKLTKVMISSMNVQKLTMIKSRYMYIYIYMYMFVYIPG